MRVPRTATFVIAAVTVLAWLLIALMGAVDRAAVLMGFIPARLSGFVEIVPGVPALLTPLSATLVHSGLVHLALNVIILLWCGNLVERVLGKTALLILYVAGAYVAAVAQWLADPASIVPGVGASGAVSAVIGAFALSFGQQKRIVASPRLNRLLNTLWLLVAWVVVQLLFGWAAGLHGVLIGTAAHIGGFVAGLVLQRPLLLWRYRRA